MYNMSHRLVPSGKMQTQQRAMAMQTGIAVLALAAAAASRNANTSAVTRNTLKVTHDLLAHNDAISNTTAAAQRRVLVPHPHRTALSMSQCHKPGIAARHGCNNGRHCDSIGKQTLSARAIAGVNDMSQRHQGLAMNRARAQSLAQHFLSHVAQDGEQEEREHLTEQ
jgi:hypothetical protein